MVTFIKYQIFYSLLTEKWLFFLFHSHSIDDRCKEIQSCALLQKEKESGYTYLTPLLVDIMFLQRKGFCYNQN